MTQVHPVLEALDLQRRQREIDGLSPAARVLEQRSIDERARQIAAWADEPVVPCGHALGVYKLHLCEVLARCGNIRPLDSEQLAAAAAEIQRPHLLLIRCQAQLERMLAAQGDSPDPSLVTLQREVAEKLQGIALPF